MDNLYREELENRQISIKLFASIKQIMHSSELMIDIPNEVTVFQIKKMVFEKFPQLEKSKIPFFVAVNHNYAKDSDLITTKDEVALIPPVSGG